MKNKKGKKEKLKMKNWKRGKLFGGTVPPNNTLFGGTVPPNNTLFGGTVPPNSTLEHLI